MTPTKPTRPNRVFLSSRKAEGAIHRPVGSKASTYVIRSLSLDLKANPRLLVFREFVQSNGLSLLDHFRPKEKSIRFIKTTHQRGSVQPHFHGIEQNRDTEAYVKEKIIEIVNWFEKSKKELLSHLFEDSTVSKTQMLNIIRNQADYIRTIRYVVSDSTGKSPQRLKEELELEFLWAECSRFWKDRNCKICSAPVPIFTLKEHSLQCSRLSKKIDTMNKINKKIIDLCKEYEDEIRETSNVFLEHRDNSPYSETKQQKTITYLKSNCNTHKGRSTEDEIPTHEETSSPSFAQLNPFMPNDVGSLTDMSALIANRKLQPNASSIQSLEQQLSNEQVPVKEINEKDEIDISQCEIENLENNNETSMEKNEEFAGDIFDDISSEDSSSSFKININRLSKTQYAKRGSNKCEEILVALKIYQSQLQQNPHLQNYFDDQRLIYKIDIEFKNKYRNEILLAIRELVKKRAEIVLYTSLIRSKLKSLYSSHKTHKGVRFAKSFCDLRAESDCSTPSKAMGPKRNGRFLPTNFFSDGEYEINRRKEIISNMKNNVLSYHDFVFIKELGKGAYGSVELMQQKNSKELYAIKSIKLSKSVTPNQMKLLHNEISILSIIKGRFLAKAFFSFVDNNCLYIAMEYLRGGDFKQRLDEHGRFEAPLARFYLAELLLAIEELHARKVVHRDLKPSNLMIDGQGHLKLADFGLSEVKKKGAEKKKSNMVGTADYMAPEVLFSTEWVEAAEHMVDWWAFGCLVYEFLVGISPFSSPSLEETFTKIKEREIDWPDIGEGEDMMSPTAKDLIEKLLVSDPTKRLGAKGVDLIKAHPFFEGVRFENLHETFSPFQNSRISMIRIPTDVSRRSSTRITMRPELQELVMCRHDLLHEKNCKTFEQELSIWQTVTPHIRALDSKLGC